MKWILLVALLATDGKAVASLEYSFETKKQCEFAKNSEKVNITGKDLLTLAQYNISSKCIQRKKS
jgi:hypothetical protein